MVVYNWIQEKNVELQRKHYEIDPGPISVFIKIS